MSEEKNGVAKKPDVFALDLEREPTGSVDVMENSHVYEDSDVPSIYLRGVIPGPTSGEASEDPNFSEIRDTYGPRGVVLTAKELREAQDASCRRYHLDPHYAGIIDSFIFFVIGKGFQVTAQDESQEVEDYLEAFREANEWDGRDRDIVLKSLRAGEVFVRVFTTTKDGRPAQIPVIRLLDYWEITEIVTDPNDRETVLSYRRPYRDASNQTQYEEIPADEIIHIKLCPRDEKRARPFFSQIAQACEWYSDWIFNRVVLNRLKTSYYLEEIVEGTPANVTTQDEMTPDAVYKRGLRGKTMKRMPKPGSKLTHNKAVEYKWLSPDVKADDAKEDGRVIRLAICAGAQIPEFILGDASNANYASTFVSQNPFVRKVEWLQDFYQPFFEAIFEWALEYGVENKFIPSLSTETVAVEALKSLAWWKRVPRVLKAKVNRLFEKKNIQTLKRGLVLKETIDMNAQGDQALVTKQVVETNTCVDIQWPNLITQDLLKDSQAYVIQQGMGIVSKETLSQKLGYDYEEEKRKLQQEQEEDAENGVDPYANARDEAINQDGKDTSQGSDGSGTAPAGDSNASTQGGGGGRGLP